MQSILAPFSLILVDSVVFVHHFVNTLSSSAKKQVHDFQFFAISATLSCLRLFFRVLHTFHHVAQNDAFFSYLV